MVSNPLERLPSELILRVLDFIDDPLDFLRFSSICPYAFSLVKQKLDLLNERTRAEFTARQSDTRTNTILEVRLLGQTGQLGLLSLMEQTCCNWEGYDPDVDDPDL